MARLPDRLSKGTRRRAPGSGENHVAGRWYELPPCSPVERNGIWGLVNDAEQPEQDHETQRYAK